MTKANLKQTQKRQRSQFIESFNKKVQTVFRLTFLYFYLITFVFLLLVLTIILFLNASPSELPLTTPAII